MMSSVCISTYVGYKLRETSLTNLIASAVAPMDNYREFHDLDDIDPEIAAEYEDDWETGSWISKLEDETT